MIRRLAEKCRIALCGLFLLFSILTMCPDTNAIRAVPDDNLAYPVLITLQDGYQGSGFFLNTQSGTFLVTARHVLFKEATEDLLAPAAQALSYPKNLSEQGKNLFVLDLAGLKRDGMIRPHASHDVAVIQIGRSDPAGKEVQKLKLLKGVQLKETAASGILGVAESTIKRFNEVLTANQVFIFGYPTSLGIKIKGLPQFDYQKPLLRSGIVAGTNEKSKTIILDCPSYGGNSGGPVLEVESEGLGRKFRVIGVVSQFVPAVEVWENKTHKYSNINVGNSGYTVAIPMNFVLELVKSIPTQSKDHD